MKQNGRKEWKKGQREDKKLREIKKEREGQETPWIEKDDNKEMRNLHRKSLRRKE